MQFVVGLGDKVAPTDIEEGMRVGCARAFHSAAMPAGLQQASLTCLRLAGMHAHFLQGMPLFTCALYPAGLQEAPTFVCCLWMHSAGHVLGPEVLRFLLPAEWTATSTRSRSRCRRRLTRA